MKLKTKLIIGAVVLIGCVGGAILYLMEDKDPIEHVAKTVLDNPHTAWDMTVDETGIHFTKKPKLSPEFIGFVSWYKPMVIDASPEVRAVMKRFDPKFRSGWANRNEEIEQHFPTDEWLQRLLDMGIVIEDYSDYSYYLNDRWTFVHAQNDPEDLSTLKERCGLDADASWEEALEAGIWESVKLNELADRAMDADPLVSGGSLSKDGVFIPFRFKTVYVKGSYMQSGRGVPKWLPRELTDRAGGRPPSREIPDDIDIIYLDEKGQPLPEAEQQKPRAALKLEPPAPSTGEYDTFTESGAEEAPLPADFDAPFEDDFIDQTEASKTVEFETSAFPESEAELEAHFTPELPTEESIESAFSERLSPERLENAQQVLNEYGTEEGLRRRRETDPEAAKQLERTERQSQHAPPVEAEPPPR